MSTTAVEHTTDEFIEPTSIKEAEMRHVEASARISRIQAQLGEDEAPPRGTPEYTDWLHWRKRAKMALSYAQLEASRLKVWIKYQRQELAVRGIPTPAAEEPDVDDLLEACYRTLKVIMRHHDYLPNPDQVVILEAAERYLQRQERLAGA